MIVFGGDVAGSPMQLRRVNTVGAFVADRLVPRLPRLRLSPAASPHDGIVAGRLSGPSSGAAAAAGNCQVDPSVLELLLLHCSPRHALEPLRDLHPAYYTCTTDTTNTLGYDYGRVFADGPSYHEGDGRAYEGYGVDKSGPGCVLLVRPDGYVVGVVGLAEGEGDGMAACETLEGWLAAMIRTRDG